MGNIFNEDFRDFLNALNDSGVEYILAGGYSVILHGYSRNTGDLDIWVNPTFENYQLLKKAFHLFRMPLFYMTEHNFLENEHYNVFTFGRPPVSIDIMTEIKGLHFMETFQASEIIAVDGLSVRLINYDNLIKAKKASGRSKDLDDLENLRKGK